MEKTRWKNIHKVKMFQLSRIFESKNIADVLGILTDHVSLFELIFAAL